MLLEDDIGPSVEDVLEDIYYQHDVVCNQKYGGIHPYSFHLKAVEAQARKYKYLLKGITDNDYWCVRVAAGGHDLIEDARFTFNDVRDRYGLKVAEIIYACTDEKGKDRSERHSNKFFAELDSVEYAVYVKLCDIIANVLYSMLTNSSMYRKYQNEFPNLYEKLFVVGELEPMWDDLRELLKM